MSPMPFLDRPGARLYYDVTGQGPPVIFVHGLGGNHASWWQQIPEFARRWTCVAFAARGFHPSRLLEPLPGDASMVDTFVGDLSALVDELQLDGIRLVAQSMGGWTSLEYTLAHSDRVRALVLADTTGTVKSDVESVVSDSEALFARGIHPACGERMLREQPELHWLYRSIDDLSFDIDKQAIRAALAAARTRGIPDVAGLEVPVLGIAGAEDVVIPPGAVKAVVEAMPNGHFEEVPAAGHSVYFERAGTFNRLVEAFFTP